MAGKKHRGRFLLFGSFITLIAIAGIYLSHGYLLLSHLPYIIDAPSVELDYRNGDLSLDNPSAETSAFRLDIAPGWRLIASELDSPRLVNGELQLSVTLNSYLSHVWMQARFAIGLMLLLSGFFLVSISVMRRRFFQAIAPLAALTDDAMAIAEMSPSGRLQSDGSNDLKASLAKLRDRLYEQRDLFEKRAYQDHLTGLSGREAFQEVLQQQTKRAESSGERFALLFIDLDGFKQVNDTFGHTVGDELLVQVAERLKTAVRSSDVITIMKDHQLMTSLLARLGGDEFTVLLTELKDNSDVAVVAERILGTFDNEFLLIGKSVRINASIGIAIYPDSASTAEGLLQVADVAMYQAKADGKGTYRLYASEMGNEVRRRHYLSRELRSAMEQEQFCLHFQPIIHIDSCFIEFFEALIRWKHPEAGWIAPAEFIPVAEERGLICQLGDWVLQQACQQMAIWFDAGINRARVSVNISPVQLSQRELYSWVMETLQRNGLPARCLMLEINENCLLDASDKTMSALQQLRGEGVKIAIDDFGSGYISLSMLAVLPVDVLKIERSFISQALTSGKYRNILTSIMELAGKLELTVIAEGVEHSDEFNLLRELNCTCIQGYLVSRPQTAQMVESKLIDEGYKQLAHTGKGLWVPPEHSELPVKPS